MKILHIIQCTNLGGMEHTALILAKRLVQRGVRWQFVSLNPLGQLGGLLHEEGIPAQGLDYRGSYGWRSIPDMAQAFRRADADAVIMTGHNASAMLALGSICPNRRLLSMHFHHAGVKPVLHWKIIYRIALKQFPAIVYPSDFIRREAESMCPSICSIAHTIRNPFDIYEPPDPAQRQQARRALNLLHEGPVVGNAGWLIERKRFDIFLLVAQAVVSQFPKASFVIAGDGPLRGQLERMAASLGIASNVKWLGWHSDLSEFYRALDVLLFNSDWDAMGRTPLEALGFGVPVVASVLNGGLSEVLAYPNGGFVRADHDIEWLADKVCNLLASPDRAHSIGMAGRAHLAMVGDVDRYCDEVSNLLRLTNGN